MRTITFLMIAGLATLAACTAADVQAPEPLAKTPAEVWRWDDHIEDLREQSCPTGETYRRAQSIDLRVIEAERGSTGARDRQLSGLSLAGAWQLESDAPDFGGLSGLDVLRSGSLLSVSDAGAFVWIGIEPTTGQPDGLGSIAKMRDAEGTVFKSKLAADAEGLSLRDGVALVSFERQHRIEAYNLERCGSASRAARVVDLDPVIDGHVIGSNRGAEGFTMDGEALLVGFETHRSGGSPLARVRETGALELQTYTEQPALYLLTGMDKVGDLTARVFRAYDPARGARVILQVDGPDGRIADAHFKAPLPVDNFEAVAIGANPEGDPRIWIISDNNFSRDQRTLLLALDLD
ncbi:MAG: esterase-like activity of phytase family protein [Pseudomonadota bacterium]